MYLELGKPFEIKIKRNFMMNECFIGKHSMTWGRTYNLATGTFVENMTFVPENPCMISDHPFWKKEEWDKISEFIIKNRIMRE